MLPEELLILCINGGSTILKGAGRADGLGG